MTKLTALVHPEDFEPVVRRLRLIGFSEFVVDETLSTEGYLRLQWWGSDTDAGHVAMAISHALQHGPPSDVVLLASPIEHIEELDDQGKVA